jgi:dihydropteroate synthase
MPERWLPAARGVVAGRPEAGGGAATPSFALPGDAAPGIPGRPADLRIGTVTLRWGVRTYVMGILNVTPDSFSGDGLMQAAPDRAAAPATPSAAVDAAVALAGRMVADGADLLDVGGESSRPGHEAVPEVEELTRVVPVVAALRAELPEVPVSIDTTKPAVAEAALAAGASLLNDIWGVAEDAALARVAARHGVPIVLMHNRAEARYRNVVAEVIADLGRAIDGALAAGVAWDSIIVDPGIGFGKTPDQNLALLRDLASLGVLGRPILLGTSRKSTLGKVLDLPPAERLEASLATTALAPTLGADIVRVHDVRANVRAARMADAILRGWRPVGWESGGDR